MRSCSTEKPECSGFYLFILLALGYFAGCYRGVGAGQQCLRRLSPLLMWFQFFLGELVRIRLFSRLCIVSSLRSTRNGCRAGPGPG